MVFNSLRGDAMVANSAKVSKDVIKLAKSMWRESWSENKEENKGVQVRIRRDERMRWMKTRTTWRSPWFLGIDESPEAEVWRSMMMGR